MLCYSATGKRLVLHALCARFSFLCISEPFSSYLQFNSRIVSEQFARQTTWNNSRMITEMRRSILEDILVVIDVVFAKATG